MTKSQPLNHFLGGSEAGFVGWAGVKLFSGICCVFNMRSPTTAVCLPETKGFSGVCCVLVTRSAGAVLGVFAGLLKGDFI
jgi:hypothetical protein